jgi:hypothetical protein
MSAAHRLRALALCVVMGLTSSLGAKQVLAAADPCVGLVFTWAEKAPTLDLADGVCVSVRVAQLLEYASCWPSASARPGRTDAGAFALLSFHDGPPAGVPPGCMLQRDCLCMALHIDGRTPFLTITSHLSGNCTPAGTDPPAGSRGAFARPGTLPVPLQSTTHRAGHREMAPPT